MKDYAYKQPDFDNPSFLFRLEDKLKGFLGGLLYKTYIKDFALKGDERVLDFGCGGAVESRFLLAHLKNGGQLTCVDTSRYWIQKAKKRLKKYANADCIAGDIRKLEIRDEFFDMIFTIHVIHDIPPGERQSIVDALVRKLKPGCAFFIWEPTKASHGMAAEEI